jgi:hypothetical protein
MSRTACAAWPAAPTWNSRLRSHRATPRHRDISGRDGQEALRHFTLPFKEVPRGKNLWVIDGFEQERNFGCEVVRTYRARRLSSPSQLSPNQFVSASQLCKAQSAMVVPTVTLGSIFADGPPV